MLFHTEKKAKSLSPFNKNKETTKQFVNFHFKMLENKQQNEYKGIKRKVFIQT